MQTPDPASIPPLVEPWFAAHQRPLPWRVGYDPYQVWISEVMLQQTRMEVVLPYFVRFVARFPTVPALAAASEDEVLSAWSGLGYYRRAKMLRAGAADVMERFGGQVPSTVEELLTIAGVGRYTAGAIASVAHDRKAPIVDGNVARIVARIFGIEAALGTPALMREAWLRAELLVQACEIPRSFNQGLMEIGALICKPRNPACGICPLREVCVAARSGRSEELPRPKAKAPTIALRIPLYLIDDGRGRILMRRERGALMSEMYHLPHGDASLLDASVLRVTVGALLGTVRHTITNRRIEFLVHAATLAGAVRDDDRHEWIALTELGRYAHPSYVQKALKLM